MRPPERNLTGADGMALGVTVVMVTAAGLSFDQIFPGAPLATLVLPAAVGSVVCSTALTRWRGWSLSAAAMASGGACLLIGTVICWRTAPTPTALMTTADSLRAAPDRILTAAFPAPAEPELLILVTAVVWAMGHAASEFILRTRSAAGPLLVLAAAVAVPVLLSGSHHPGLNRGLLALVTVGAGALIMARHRDTRGPEGTDTGPAAHQVTTTHGARRLQQRRALTAVPLVVVAGLAPMTAGGRLPLTAEEPRFDLRDEPVGEAFEMRNPLVEVTVQRDAPQTEELFVAEAPGEIEFWRIMSLDTFDGTRWTSSGTFVRSGRHLPQPDTGIPQGTDSHVVPQTVTLSNYTGSLLPTTGRPLTIRADVPVAFDADGAALEALERPDGELTYTVESALTDPSDADLDLAVRDREGPDAEAATQPIEDAGLLVDVAMEQVTSRSGGMTGSADIRQLRALQEFFADQGRFNLAPEPTGGLTLAHLSTFVAVALEGGPSEGSVEQFATTFAVMARTLGYPSRVAVGYRTPAPDADGIYRVTNRDAFAWTEIKLEGMGWVPFVAGPVRTEEEPPPIELPETTTTTPDDTTTDSSTEQAEDLGGPDEVDDRGTGGSWSTLLVRTILVALVAIVTAPALWRALRRFRRSRASDPADQILGAWQHLLDWLAAHGVSVTPAMTAADVLASLEDHFGDRPPEGARRLADLVNRARFAPLGQRPGTGAEAWGETRMLRRGLRRHMTWPDRLRAWFDLRSLNAR